jgi:hypothetical protein
MAVFEMESWIIAEGRRQEHDEWMRRWLNWVRAHRELFKEWKSVRYFVKSVAGNESGRHFIVWEYESLAEFEAYKKRRGDYQGPYAEYKLNDPYHQNVFVHGTMEVEFWNDQERGLWIE